MKAIWNGTQIASSEDTVVVEDFNSDAAWYSAEPKVAAKQIAGHVAFWRGVQITD